MNGFVVVDASLAFKWLVREKYADEADALVERWNSHGTRVVAPHLMPVEVSNALHRRVVRAEMSVQEGARLIQRLLSSGIELHETANLHGRSLELASLLDQGPVYDAHYLVLAEALECELWTADERFYVAASSVAQNVHWLGEFVVPEEQLYEEPCQES